MEIEELKQKLNISYAEMARRCGMRNRSCLAMRKKNKFKVIYVVSKQSKLIFYNPNNPSARYEHEFNDKDIKAL